jgi:AP-2 complex subunit mu-1
MFSGVFFLSTKGEILISRVYRDDITKAVSEAFRLHVISAKDIRSPIKTIINTHILHIRVENVFIMTATKANVNLSTIFEVLYKIVGLLRTAFGGAFNEEEVRQNHILIYELLDEMLDHGYPQTTGDELFKLYITQKGKFEGKKKGPVDSAKATSQVTGAIPWRPPDLRYKKNEMFIDVIESVNVLYSSKGQVLHADVSGEIKMKSFLSGMPECRFGMNDKLLMDREAKGPGAHTGSGSIAGVHSSVAAKSAGSGIEIDDCTFHQCVKLGKFDADRSITFIPPDGEFILMRYRTTESISTPFRVMPIVTETATRCEIKVTVKADFHNKMFGNDVIVTIPTPKNTANAKVQVAHGRARYEPGSNAIVWRIRKFPGEMELTLGAELELLATNKLGAKQWVRPPIAMQFSVPMFTASGLHVRFLKVVEPKLHYQTVKWVRYITQAGSYQHRC